MNCNLCRERYSFRYKLGVIHIRDGYKSKFEL